MVKVYLVPVTGVSWHHAVPLSGRVGLVYELTPAVVTVCGITTFSTRTATYGSNVNFNTGNILDTLLLNQERRRVTPVLVSTLYFYTYTKYSRAASPIIRTVRLSILHVIH